MIKTSNATIALAAGSKLGTEIPETKSAPGTLLPLTKTEPRINSMFSSNKSVTEIERAITVPIFVILTVYVKLSSSSAYALSTSFSVFNSAVTILVSTILDVTLSSMTSGPTI